jgi:hypothetical protein
MCSPELASLSGTSAKRIVGLHNEPIEPHWEIRVHRTGLRVAQHWHRARC